MIRSIAAGLVAAFALISFAAVADEAPKAEAKEEKAEKKEKKADKKADKKAEKAEKKAEKAEDKK